MKTIDLDSIKIHPISTEEDFEKANEIIEALIDADMIEKDRQQQQKALAILNAVTVLAGRLRKSNISLFRRRPTPLRPSNNEWKCSTFRKKKNWQSISVAKIGCRKY